MKEVKKKKKKERNKHFSWHSGGIGTGVVDHQITKNVLHGEWRKAWSLAIIKQVKGITHFIFFSFTPSIHSKSSLLFFSCFVLDHPKQPCISVTEMS
jgi:hypothetical protein